MTPSDIYYKDEENVTPQEDRMILHVLSGMTIRAAAQAAGFEFKDHRCGAKRIMLKPQCKRRLAQLRAEAAKRAKITQDDVIEGFKDAIGDAKLLSDPTAQIAGWREIAKMLGLYAVEVKKVEVSHVETKAREELAQLSEEDLQALLEDGSAIDGEFRILDS